MSERDLQRALDAMLADKPLPSVRLSAEELAVLQTAARLRASRDDAAAPSPQFVDALARRLRDGQRSDSRRRFLQRAGIAAAAAAVGVGADRLLATTVLSSQKPAAAAGTLTPQGGVWTPVTTLTALRSTPVVRFTAGAVTGFVISAEGSITALSAICTHQGCVLAAAGDNRSLVCPCHNQTFALDGSPNYGDYYLSPLPSLQHRISGDAVEVLVAAV
jgi:cytochrome b6-f complex iron-sulfur subunit